MRRRHPFFRVLGAIVFLSSASSFLSAGDPTDPVYVRSSPAGARVIVDGELEGTTPILLYLSTSAAHSIRIEHGGYEEHETVVRPVLRWNVLRHMLFTGPALGTVETAADLRRDGTHRLSPQEIEVMLRRFADLDARLAPRVLGGFAPR